MADEKELLSVELKSEYFLDVQVFLEGIQVPHVNVNVSYGVGQPCTATIVVPSCSSLLSLPDYTKVHIFFMDLVDGNRKLLFDGEMARIGYNLVTHGSSMIITAIHSTGYLDLMQILTLNSEEFMYTRNGRIVGESTVPIVMGNEYVKMKVIEEILKKKGIENSADLVYRLVGTVVSTTEGSSVTKFYNDKLKLHAVLDRVYGVSDAAKTTPFPVLNRGNRANPSNSPSGGSSSDTITGGASAAVSHPSSDSLESEPLVPTTAPPEGSSDIITEIGSKLKDLYTGFTNNSASTDGVVTPP